MSSLIVYEWQIYCETEATWVIGYGPNELTTCPNGPSTHTVTSGSTQKLRSFNTKAVTVKPYEPEPGQLELAERKQLRTVILRDDNDTDDDPNVLRGNTVSKMVWTSPPHPIVIYSIKANTSAHQKGDILNLWVSKNTGIGTTTTVTAADSTSFVASTSPVVVADLLYTGYSIALADGTGVEVLGHVTAINSATNTITCEYATTRELASGAAILLSIHTVDNVRFGDAGPMTFGDDLPSALGYLAPNTPVTIWYDNQHPRPKSWQVQLTIGYGSKT